MAGVKKSGFFSSGKNLLITGVMLTIIASGILAWAKVNNIRSINDAYDYFKGVSDHINNCGGNKAEWNCDKSLGNGGSTGNSGSGDSNNPGGSTGSNVNSSALVKQLNGLTISSKLLPGYDRSEWPHWIGAPCNARKKVLIRDAKKIDVDKSNGKCSIKSGTWIDPYTNSTITDSNSLDIDHVIPLGYAAAHGGQPWSTAQKQAYANDLTLLLAVDSSQNRSKSDKGPSGYMPPNKDFQCEYATIWVQTATKYHLSIAADDKNVLQKALMTCKD